MTQHTRRLTAVLVGLPVALGAAGIALTRSWLPDLPATVASHWGPSGQADGFVSKEAATWLTGFGALAGLIVAAAVLPLSHRIGSMRRTTAGVVGGLAGFGTVLSVLLLADQRGLADAHGAQLNGWVFGWAFAAAALAGAVGAVLAPGADPGEAVASGPVPVHALRTSVPPEDGAAWLGRASSAAVLYAVLVVALVPFVVLAVLTRSLPVPALLVIAFVAVLVVSMSSFRVEVGAAGLSVRSVLGWPRFHVPLAEVAEAVVVTVSPMREFGGWGVRIGRDGRFGVVLRSGPALEVLRGDDTRFVVTVDDAEGAAALLNTLADRERVSG